MDAWVRYWSQRTAVVGGCLTLVAGPILGVSLPVMVFRALVVGVVLYVAVRVMGGLVGRALLWLALAEQEKAESRRKPEGDDDESDSSTSEREVRAAVESEASVGGADTGEAEASEKVAA